MTPGGLRRAMPLAAKAALSAVGLLAVPYLYLANRDRSAFAFDTWCYWSVDLGNIYGRSLPYGNVGAFVYSPPAAFAFAPARLVPFEVFVWLWLAVLLAALAWLGRSWALALVAFPPIALELYHGNIHLLLAVAMVVGFRHPGAWAFVLLTKPSCGVGLLWFVARRDWRSLAVALGTTAAIAVPTLILAPDMWRQWVAMLVAASGEGTTLFLRLPVAAVVVWYGALRGWRWAVPLGAVIAAPVLWWLSPAMLAAVPRLRRTEAPASLPRGADGGRLRATVGV